MLPGARERVDGSSDRVRGAEHGEVSCACDETKGRPKRLRRPASCGDRVDRVFRTPQNQCAGVHRAQLRQVEALDPIPQHRAECVERPLHLERALPLVEELARERRMVRIRVGEAAPEDPVRARHDPEDARDPRTYEKPAQPGRRTPGRDRVAVEQHDAVRVASPPERRGDDVRSAEGMADENWMAQSEAHLERANELRPAAQRVGALAFRVAERRQVERVHAVVAAESLADAVPDGARDDEPAEQDDRCSAAPPVAIGDQLPVETNERSGVECRRWLDGPRGCCVVRDRGYGQQYHQPEQPEADSLRPAAQARHGATLAGLVGRHTFGRASEDACARSAASRAGPPARLDS